MISNEKLECLHSKNVLFINFIKSRVLRFKKKMDDDNDHDEAYQNAVDEWDFVEGQGGAQLKTLQHGDTYSRKGSFYKKALADLRCSSLP